MSLPFFYLSAYSDQQTDFELSEENSRHIVQVLRMKPGERLFLTDGKGHLLTASIQDDHKRKCRVRVVDVERQPPAKIKVIIAISLLKNANRFEWFLEKAMEIGVSSIIPLLCERTEKQHFRRERMQNIMISALVQSRQTWLPELYEPQPFRRITDPYPFAGETDSKYIAHCLTTERLSLAAALCHRKKKGGSRLILIGPEGDFSKEEIGEALEAGFLPVALGETRLRTETAGIVAASLLCLDGSSEDPS